MKRRGSGELCEAAALAAGVEVEVEFSGDATHDDHEPDARRALGRANAEAYGIADQGMDPNVGLDGHGQRLLGRARRSTRTSRSPTSPRPATRSSSGTPPRVRAPTGRSLLAATLVAQTALDLLVDPRPRRGGLAGVPRRGRAPRRARSRRRAGALGPAPRDAWAVAGAPGARPRAASGTMPPARPAGRRTRTGGAPAEAAARPAVRAARRPRRLRRTPWPSVPTTRATSTSPRATAGTARTRRTTTSTCRPTSACRRS